MWVGIVSALALLWLGGAAWPLFWPPTILSIPFFLFLLYVMIRVVCEVTIYRNRVPTLATCWAARQQMAELLARAFPARAGTAPCIVDLGSGRGELARCLARRIPHATVLGIESAWLPYALARGVRHLLGPSNLSYERGDFWSFDVSMADAVVLFLAPVTAQRMGEKLARELRPGSLVISYTFPLLGAWEPEEVLNFRSPFPETLYVYRKGSGSQE